MRQRINVPGGFDVRQQQSRDHRLGRTPSGCTGVSVTSRRSSGSSTTIASNCKPLAKCPANRGEATFCQRFTFFERSQQIPIIDSALFP